MENEIIVNGVTYVKKEEKEQSERANGIWFIDTDGSILRDKEKATDKYKPFCYPTEAEVIKARDKMLALYRIKEYCNEQWGEFIPDWSDGEQKKYHIRYNNIYNKYDIDYAFTTQYSNTSYLSKLEHCEEIKEKFKDDLDILFDKKW